MRERQRGKRRECVRKKKRKKESAAAAVKSQCSHRRRRTSAVGENRSLLFRFVVCTQSTHTFSISSDIALTNALLFIVPVAALGTKDKERRRQSKGERDSVFHWPCLRHTSHTAHTRNTHNTHNTHTVHAIYTRTAHTPSSPALTHPHPALPSARRDAATTTTQSSIASSRTL